MLPKTLVSLHLEESVQPNNPNWLGDNEFKAVPSYKHSLPPYVNNYASTPQLFCSEWTNHNCTQRGNAPMGEKGKLIIHKKWAETSNASNQCLVRYYTSSPKPPLSKIESKYLYERHRKSGLVRWIGIKLCMGTSGSIYNGLLLVDYVEDTKNHWGAISQFAVGTVKYVVENKVESEIGTCSVIVSRLRGIRGFMKIQCWKEKQEAFWQRVFGIAIGVLVTGECKVNSEYLAV